VPTCGTLSPLGGKAKTACYIRNFGGIDQACRHRFLLPNSNAVRIATPVIRLMCVSQEREGC
jgi:hypothetical protein